MKKILILANSDIGLYNFRKEIIQGFVEENYEVHISLPNGPHVKKLIDLGCIFHETSVDRRGVNPLIDLKLIINYIKLIRNIQPNLVLTYTIKPNLYGGLVSRILNIKYIANITGIGTVFQKESFLKKIIVILYQFSLKNAETLIFQNTDNLSVFKNNKIKGKNATLVPGSGVNLLDFPYTNLRNNEEVNFLFVGRIMVEKGINEFLYVAKEMQYEKVKFHVVGEIEDPNLKKIVYQYNTEKIIDYHGFHKDVKKYIEKCDCLINPSYHEGMSNVLLEAGSMGRPLIASNISGCKEIIDDSINGYLFDVKDGESLLKVVKKFTELTNDEIKKMSKASRKKIEAEFNRNNITELYINFANNIIGGNINA
ncbi:glycosyltransferase family 4 protein [Carnobacterium sp. FSL W8-0810]|uniref:glycosyltransferase family 4 protein n=1 Tax=Carnobacterium sp. FSL W8-0810 TaxID=2954705 RepID=UPI0030F7F300